MSDTPIDSTWWLASDGKWYPPTSHPNYQPPTRPDPPEPPAAPVLEPLLERSVESGEPSLPEQEGIVRQPVLAHATALELMKLPREYHVIHGLKKGAGTTDIDQLVIGPTGVWVIDSKQDIGVFTAGKGTLWNGKYPINTKIAAVEDQAKYARDVLDVPTNAVLCFVQAELPRPAQMVGRVRVIQLDALAEHIMAGQITMLPNQIQATLERVGDWLRGPPTPRVETTRAPRRMSRSKSTRSQSTSSARTGSGRSLLMSVAIAAIIIALVAIMLTAALAFFTGVMDPRSSTNNSSGMTVVVDGQGFDFGVWTPKFSRRQSHP